MPSRGLSMLIIPLVKGQCVDSYALAVFGVANLCVLTILAKPADLACLPETDAVLTHRALTRHTGDLRSSAVAVRAALDFSDHVGPPQRRKAPLGICQSSTKIGRL